jgi:MFS family permease
MPQGVGYRELLRSNQNYRRLWLGEVVSFLGDWFGTIAQYTIVQRVTQSRQAIAAVLVAKMLPVFLVTPIAGPLVDRYDRRKLLLISDFVRMACLFLMVVASRLNNPYLLVGFLVIQMSFSGLFYPTKNSILPQITNGKELASANALSGGTWSVMLALGAAIGGTMTELLGVDLSLAFDGLTYLLSAAFLWGLPALPPQREEGEQPTSFREGLRYLAKRRYLIFVLSLKMMMSMVSGGMVLLIPIFGNGVFSRTRGPLYIGLLYSARGLGALVGSMGVRQVAGDAQRTMRRLVIVGYLSMTVAYGAATYASNVWLMAACFFTGAIGSGMIWVFSSLLAQLNTDPGFRGRLFSLEFGMMTLGFSITSWLASLSIDKLGWSEFRIPAVSATIALVAATVWAFALIYWRKQPPNEEPDSPEKKHPNKT